MEPIQHKKLSLALMVGGIALAIIGAILLITLSRALGVTLILIGIVMFLIGLPTMMLLSMYSAKQELDKIRK